MGLRLRLDRMSLAFGALGAAWMLGGMCLGGWPVWVGAFAVGLALAGAARLTGPDVRLAACVAGALLVPASLFAGLSAWPMANEWSHRESFDAARWRAAAGVQAEWPPRLRMSRDLVRRDFRGWRREEVVALLGSPDGTEGNHAERLVYILGTGRGFFGIDPDLLVFTFGADGRATSWRITPS